MIEDASRHHASGVDLYLVQVVRIGIAGRSR
jgi:hypothetical protein